MPNLKFVVPGETAFQDLLCVPFCKQLFDTRPDRKIRVDDKFL